MIQQSPYQDLVIDFIKYKEYSKDSFNIVLINNDVPIELTKEYLYDLDNSFWSNEYTTYCLVYFNTYKLEIRPSNLGVLITVTDKNNELWAQYNTIDYRMVFGWMSKYFV